MSSMSAPILDAQRRDEEKKRQKRAANRKSAYTSRARKKQFVEEMTVANRDLKQHAHILDLLPDLIIVVDRHERISYVSKSVSLKLRYSPDSLVGSPVCDLVTPQTRHVIATSLHWKGFNSVSSTQSCHSGRPSARRGNGSGSSGDDVSIDGSDESLARKAAAHLNVQGPPSSTNSSVGSPVRSGGPAVSLGAMGADDMRRGAEAVAARSSDSRGWGGGGGQPRKTASARTAAGHAEARRPPPRSRGDFSSSMSSSAEPSTGTTATSSGTGGGGGSSSTTGGSSTSGTVSSNASARESSGNSNATRSSGNSSDGDTESQGQGSSGEAEDQAGSDGGRTYAKWSHVNLQRHNQEIDQLSDQAVWKVCMIRSDRTSLWCEMSVNMREQSGVTSEVVLSMRPVRDGSRVPEDYVIISNKGGHSKAAASSSRDRTAGGAGRARGGGGTSRNGGYQYSHTGSIGSLWDMSECSTTSSISASSPGTSSSLRSVEGSKKGQQKPSLEKLPRRPEIKVPSADLTVAETLLGLCGK